MDRYRVAPSRPVFLSGASHRLQPASGRRSGGPDMELDIFTAERYFNAADAVKYSAAAVHAADAPTNQTAASSEASWNSRSGLLASNRSSSTASAARQHDKVIGHGGGNAIDLGLGLVVEVVRDDRCHRGGGKKTGQRWGLFSRDCPCAGRKAVTVDVASEPPSPTTPRIHHPRIDALEERAVFKANGLPPPSPTDEPGVMKIVSTAGSRAFPLRASIDGVIPPAPNHGGSGGTSSFPAFPPDVGRRKKGGGFLNSCRCEKAVSVGPTPVRVARPPAVPAMGLESGGAARYHNRRVHMPVRT